MELNGHKIEISNRKKLFFPDVGLTKGDLIDYYHKIADTMLPHIKWYCISMQRFPDGLQGEGWYAKNVPDYFPEWIKTVNFPKREGGSFNAPIVDSAAVLVYLADQAMITPHLYLSRKDDLEHPDRLIYDLDPPEDTEDFSLVRHAALAIRDICKELELKSWVQTTGSMGFHIVVPLDQSWRFDKVKDFADDVARVLVRRQPENFTLEERKNKRGERIFLDTLRNSYGATAVAPYGVRARPEASIATPLDWEEVADGAKPRDWTIKNIFLRLGQKDDPWTDMMKHAQSLEKKRRVVDELLDYEEPVDEEN